jgi:hypothetical protein
MNGTGEPFGINMLDAERIGSSVWRNYVYKNCRKGIKEAFTI